jgi:hypothetical protein
MNVTLDSLGVFVHHRATLAQQRLQADCLLHTLQARNLIQEGITELPVK